MHPGPRGDRGPSSLDWAIELGEREWGVTVLQADREADAGDVWASRSFPTRPAPKSSLYRHEVRRAAIAALVEAVEKVARGAAPAPLDARDPRVTGRERPLMRQPARAIDWATEHTAAVVRKLRAADGHPGVLDEIGGTAFHLFGAHPEPALRGRPGEIVAQRHGAICRATVDGAVWISHLKAHRVLQAAGRPGARAGRSVARRARAPRDAARAPIGFRELGYEEIAGVGYLHFDFYNGAMSTEQCRRLREAYLSARSRSETA